MSSLDLIAAIAAGFFLVTVATKGNTAQLIALAQRDKNYLQWAVAVGILAYLYRQPELKGVAGLLIAGAFIALGLKAGPQIIQNGAAFWKQLGTPGKATAPKNNGQGQTVSPSQATQNNTLPANFNFGASGTTDIVSNPFYGNSSTPADAGTTWLN